MFFTGCARTVMRIVMLDLVSSELTASAEGWSLTTTGILEIAIIPLAGNYSVIQGQKAVFAYFPSKQILHFGFAWQYLYDHLCEGLFAN